MTFAATIAAALLLAAPQEPPERISEFCPLYLIFFESGSARLTPQAVGVIDNWITVTRMVESPENRFTIESNTDPIGSAESNLELAFRRGRSVMRYLVGRGFDPARIRIRAMGESAQWGRTEGLSAEEELAQNRHATLIFETTGSNYRRAFGDRIC